MERSRIARSKVGRSLSEQERRERADARRRYLDRLDKQRARQKALINAEELKEQERLKEEARLRFKLANPRASEKDFEACWLITLEELDRRRSERELKNLTRC